MSSNTPWLPPLPCSIGSGPLLPKPRALYEPFDKSYTPSVPNIFSSADDAYWKAVRQAAAPCFSISNLKQVGGQVEGAGRGGGGQGAG